MNDGKAFGAGEIRGYLIQLGWNMWSDIPVKSWGPIKGDDLKYLCAADHFRTELDVWNRVTEEAAKSGYNLLLVDLGEAMVYPSHPELAVRGSWSVGRMREELARLRRLGLEPIPKLNFSTSHDTWLGPYERMVSTPEYYSVCTDIIRDVAEIFDHPRFMHLGFDEETARDQRQYRFCVARQGDLWWHDVLWFAATVEKTGMRPWVWSDAIWRHKDEYLSKMPKSVLQSNWYYESSFDPAEKPKNGGVLGYVDAYLALEKAGFDQVPTASNWLCDENLEKTVAFARQNIAPSRLKGFLMAPWFFTDAHWENRLMDACRLGRSAWQA